MGLVKINEKNIDQFKFLPFNRSYKVRKDLIQSMNKNGFTVPIILVEANLYGRKETYIADGQHRLATSQYLGIDAYGYKVDVQPKDIFEMVDFVSSLNSSQKNWTINDYCEAYAYLNVESYKKLIEIKSKSICSLSIIASLLHRNSKYGGTFNQAIVRTGKLEINFEKEVLNTITFSSKLSKYYEINIDMFVALHKVCNLNNFNENKFILKFSKHANILKDVNNKKFQELFLNWID